MNNRKLQIFISSTYTDLRDERQAAVEAILKAGHIPAGMELFAAGNESQMETIRRWIESSDIYMLILGGRYGSIDPKTGLSYVESEYHYAVSLKKPIFAVVIDNKNLSNKLKKKGTKVVELEHIDEYVAFRKKVLSKTCSFFKDAKDVKLCILESVPDIQKKYDLKGWVSVSEIPDTKALVSEINRLLGENTKLLKINENLTKKLDESTGKLSTKKDYEELIDVLDKTEIESIMFDANKKSPKKVSLLTLFSGLSDKLVTGVTNQMGTSKGESFLYFDVCPKLQIHGLVENERAPGAQWRRFKLTKKGADLLAYMAKEDTLKKAPISKHQTVIVSTVEAEKEG